jgi:hypothetical protein
LGAPLQREPSGQSGVPERGSDRTVGDIGHVKKRGLGHQRSLRHRPIGRDRGVEVHPPPIGQTTHAVAAGHRRKRRSPTVEVVRRLIEIEVIDRRRLDLDNHRAFTLSGMSTRATDLPTIVY